MTTFAFAVGADACTGCGACLLTCPEHAFRPGPQRIGGGRAPMILTAVCTGCGECAEICPEDACREVPA